MTVQARNLGRSERTSFPGRRSHPTEPGWPWRSMTRKWWTPDLWVLDLARGSKTRLTFGPVAVGSPVWEPDGQAVIFGSIQNSQQHIFRKSLTGTGASEVVLQTDGAIDSPRSTCRDGRYLAYQHAEAGGNAKFGVWILPLFGDRKPFPLVEGQFAATDPRISPSCRWVAYLSAEPGQPQIYITDFPDGKRNYEVTTAGGDKPPRGRESTRT